MAMYISVICLSLSLIFLLYKYSFVSLRLNGCKWISWLMWLCKPPLLRIILLIIQEAEEPQTISLIRLSLDQY